MKLTESQIKRHWHSGRTMLFRAEDILREWAKYINAHGGKDVTIPVALDVLERAREKTYDGEFLERLWERVKHAIWVAEHPDNCARVGNWRLFGKPGRVRRSDPNMLNPIDAETFAINYPVWSTEGMRAS